MHGVHISHSGAKLIPVVRDLTGLEKEFPRFGVGNGRGTDLRLGLCHCRQSGSFFQQALGEHDLDNDL